MQLANSRTVNCRIAFIVCSMAVLLMMLATSLPQISLFDGRREDHLSIHLLLETFCVIVSAMVVTIAWSSLHKNNEAISKPLIFGFTVIAGADLSHAIAYDGMPSLIVEGSVSRGIFYWLSGRTAEILTLLLIVSGLRLPGSRNLWLALGLITSLALFMLGTHALQYFPVTFIPGHGVTDFKAHFEYLLSAANLSMAFWFFYKSRHESNTRYLWLGTACFVMGIGELAFTRYIAPSDFMNVFGHLYKVAAYGFIYRATFLASVREPYIQLQKSEQHIRAKENELHNLLVNMPIGLARMSTSGHLQYINPALSTALNKTPEQVAHLNIREIFPDNVQEAISPAIRHAASGSRTELMVTLDIDTNGIRYFHVIVTPEKLGEGNDGGILLIFTEITDQEISRQRLEESLRENSEFKSALDAHAIVAFTDARGVITRVNDKFCSISKYPRSELIGRTHNIINSGYHPREFFQDMWRTISRGQVWNGDVCNKAKDGSIYWVQTTIVPFTGSNGLPEQYIAIRADITTRKLAEAETQRMALHDALTGLPNRRLMADRLSQAIHSEARKGCYGAVLLMDLDHFKEVNDTLGHALGDELLRQAGWRLTHAVRQTDTVSRLGGDEFVVVLEDIGKDLDSAMTNTSSMGEKIRAVLAQPYLMNNLQLDVTPSIGAVLFHNTDDNPDELIKQADMALYKAKDAGRNQLCFFDPSLQAETTTRATLQRELRQALEKEELRLFYQPIVDHEQHILGVEALLRWPHPQHGMVSPATFIPIAEQSGLILPIGQWVLETACQQLAEWQQDPHHMHWSVAVNISARQLNQPDFVAKVEQALGRSGAPADHLRLELTESMLQNNLDSAIAKMEALRRLGVRFSLDDFGTGYSSLSYLKRLPLDQLKIDKSFIDDVLTDPNDASIACTVLALAKSLGMSVVAEGVETKEQMEFLLANGCKGFQGYLISRPQPASELPVRLTVL